MKTRPPWQTGLVTMSIDLKEYDTLEMEQWAEGLGLPSYRGRQISAWLFKKLAQSFEEMSDLPKPLRAFLTDNIPLNHLDMVNCLTSEDGTKKFLFMLGDGKTIESVLIPERNHWTLCISSQVGCAMGCRFCLTGSQGFTRNLTSGEIIDQVIQVRRSMDAPERLTNIVLMGMGEPLANYHHVLKALRILLHETEMNFSHRKVTVSTSGLVPEMLQLGKDITVNLAVSLNAADNETRNSLMPVNRRYPLEKLLEACRIFPLPNRRMITFEYILIDGINDSRKDASHLIKLMQGLRAKVNLIPLNPHQGSPFSPPPRERILAFQEMLVQHQLTAIIRKSKGQDILAACGQLSGNHTVPPSAICSR